MSRPLEALALRRPLWDHLRTLPLCHVAAPDFPPEQAAAWLRGAAAAGWSLPLGLARDLGLLLTRPGEVGRALHYKEQGRVDETGVLGGVLRQLRGWRAEYRNRQVLWVLSEHFDADGVGEHEALYRALHAEAGQQVWYVRVGDGGRNGKPPAAEGFRRW